MPSQKIKVLIVDDSALIRKLLSEILSSDIALEVVGTAMDPEIAKRKIKELSPDVITLDVEMPKMDGVSFLKLIMRNKPTPVLMISSLTEKGAEVTMDALEAGAIDFVSKPSSDISGTLQNFSEEIITKVKLAAKVKVYPGITTTRPVVKPKPKPQPVRTHLDPDEKFSATAIIKRSPMQNNIINTTDKVIAIGASTGGTEAIKEILMTLSVDIPPVVIVQHIPPVFSRAFAKRMDALCPLKVAEVNDRQILMPGHVYIAPGDRHLLVKRDGAKYCCLLNDGPRVNRHIPSVDVLFRSMAQYVGPNGMGIILTGMGADGARGLLEMKEAGAFTIAQDEKTSVVWGMPGEAVKRNAVEKIASLYDIAGLIENRFRSSKI